MSSNQSSNAIIAYDNGPTDHVRGIMKAAVAENTADKYLGYNSLFLIWLYEKEELREELLLDVVVDKLHVAKKVDDHKNDSNMSAMKKVCKEALQNTRRELKNSPVLLDKLTFNVYSDFLSTRKSKGENMLAVSTYGLYRSSLMELYRASGCDMNEDFKRDLHVFMGGIKRSVATEKLEKGLKLDEGKKPMSFEVYKALCKVLYKSSKADHIFCHLMLVLEWNLMARSDNVLKMMLTHVEWRNDSLVFFFGKSKSNQEGDGSHHPWHVFSNPLEPEMCPVLTLSKYLLCFPDLMFDASKTRLFPGGNQYSRYNKIFHSVLEKNKELFASLGVEKGSLGTHSIRKGAISLVSCGCTVSPPMAAICLRACWSMGPVKDRYIHYEKAGDQFVGRSVTGINCMSTEFAVSPAYFDESVLVDGKKVNVLEEVKKLLSNTVGDGSKIQASFYEVMKYMLASLCYHFDHVNNNMEKDHPLRSSPVFLALQTSVLRKLAVVRYPWNSSENTPTFTGITPYVVLMNEFKEYKKLMEAQTETIVNAMRQEMNRRGVGGEMFHLSEMLESFKQQQAVLLAKVNDMVTNCQDASRQDEIFDMFDYHEEEEDLDTSEEIVQPPPAVENIERSSTSTLKMNRRGVFIKWSNCTDGKIRLLPKDYQFPKMCVANMLVMWFCGDVSNSIPPYKMLKSSDVQHIKNGKMQLSQMKKLVDAVLRGARDVARVRGLIKKQWTTRNVLDLYEGIKHLLQFPNMTSKEKDKRRLQTIKWKTYYNILVSRKWKLMGEAR